MLIRLLTFITTIAITLSLTACGGDSKSTPQIGASTTPYMHARDLAPEDFNGSSNVQISRYGFIDELKESGILFVNSSEPDSYSDVDISEDDDFDLDRCFDYKQKFSASGESGYSVSTESINIFECIQLNEQSKYMDYAEGYISMILRNVIVTDEVGNTVDLNGVTIEELFALEESYELTQIGMALSFGYYFSASNDEKTAAGRYTHFATLFCGNSIETPCNFSSNYIEQINDISFITQELYKNDVLDKRTVSFSKATGYDLSFDRDLPFYSSGTINIAIENWSGSATFGPNGETAPWIEATNGTSTINQRFDSISTSSPPSALRALSIQKSSNQQEGIKNLISSTLRQKLSEFLFRLQAESQRTSISSSSSGLKGLER